jgi:hypothetical protein
MNIRFSAALFLVALTCFAGATTVNAQASRTWVSGVGDDANPCSRTAPCKTFAGAISKTAPGGSINAIDSGPFGPVNITKAMTLDGTESAAGIIASAGNAIAVNAGANDVVSIRGLQLNGVGSGFAGIRFNSAKALHVENTHITGFTAAAIEFYPTAAAHLFVNNTSARNNTGGGIYVKPAGGVVAFANLEKVRLENNLFGLRADDGGRVTVHDSVASDSSANGFVIAGSSANVELNLDHCVSTNNDMVGVKAVGTFATIRLSDVTVTNNANGLQAANGGSIISFGNNRLAGNSAGDGAPTSVVSQQ